MGPGGIKGVSGGATKPSKIGATMKKPDLAEIAAAPSIIATGIPTQQQQQFTALTLDASGAATQIFPHSGGTAAVLVTTTNPGVRPRGPVANPQTANPTFLLQQQQQQQHAFLAAQSKLTEHILLSAFRVAEWVFFPLVQVNFKKDVGVLLLSRCRCLPWCYRVPSQLRASREPLRSLCAPPRRLTFRLKVSKFSWRDQRTVR